MSNNNHDDLEEEANALSDTINSMPSDENDDDEDSANVLMESPKKKKPVLKYLLGLGGVLVLAMGGAVAYNEFMVPKVNPQSRQMPKMPPPLSAPVGPESVAIPGGPTEQGSQAVIDTPKLPDGSRGETMPGVSAPTEAPDPKPSPFDTPKAIESKSAVTPFDEPKLSAEKKTVHLEKNAVVKIDKNLEPAERVVKAPREKVRSAFETEGDVTSSETPKAVKKPKQKNVVKKSTKLHNVKKDVIPLPNEQRPDNGYHELF